VFEVVASAGKTIGKTERGDYVEFETTWREKVIKTIEVVELDPPRRIGYRWVEGPLDDVVEEIRFERVGSDGTAMTYSGRVGAPPGLIGWFHTLLFVRPIFNRLVRDHLFEGKRIAETRVKRSRVHPRGGSASTTRPPASG
jgi:hypothetical protein